MRLIHIFMLVCLFFPNLSQAGAPRVIFDQGHGQAFTIENQGELQLSRLAGILHGDGWQVNATHDPLTPDLLSEFDALVISGAFKPLSGTELAAVGDFLRNGGRLVVMLHIASPLSPLLTKLGVSYANGVVREGDESLVLDGQPLNFKVSNFKEHPLTRNLEFFSLYGGWPLLPLHESVYTIASTGPMAWVDLNRDQLLSGNDAVQEFAVLVTGKIGKGEFAVFGDDAIFQNRFLEGTNEKLSENLGNWMKQGK